MTHSPCPILLDASVLLNLYATGRLREIAAALPCQLAVADYVLEQEALYTWVVDPDGTHERPEPLDLSPLVHEGLIRVMRLEHPGEETYLCRPCRLD